jgi:acylphosphatase
MDAVRLHVHISGQVQGVGYRYFVLERAHALGLVGWVRNLHDRRVEILAEGERSRLELLLDHMKAGPRGSRVLEVTTEWLPATGEFSQFRITH